MSSIAGLDEPEVVAAVIAAVASTIGLLLSILSGSRQRKADARLRHFAELDTDRQRVRDELRDVVDVSERLLDTMRVFDQQRTRLAGEAMIVAAANMFGTAATFMAKTSRGRQLTYPAEVAEQLNTMRTAIISYILELELEPNASTPRPDRVHKEHALDSVSASANIFRETVTRYIRPSLTNAS